MAWAAVPGQADGLYRGGLFALALATAVVLAAAAHPQPGVLSHLLAAAPLRGLGIISYGVYLWHWPLYLVLDEARTGQRGWALVAIRVLVTLAVATVSYVVLERPVRRGQFRAPSLRLAGLASAAVLVAGLLVVTRHGVPAAEAANVRRDRRAEARREVATAPAGAPRILVEGDSVGLYLGRAFDELRTDPPLAVYRAAPPGCGFPHGASRLRGGDGKVYSESPLDCGARWADDVAVFDPDIVVLAFAPPGDGEAEYAGRWLHPCTPAYDDRYRDGLRAAVRRLGGRGATVAVVTAPYSRLFGASDVRFERTDCVNAITRRVAAEEPAAVLRPDGIHFRGEGARIVARWVLEAVRRAPGRPR